jgi:hypothetical protein
MRWHSLNYLDIGKWAAVQSCDVVSRNEALRLSAPVREAVNVLLEARKLSLIDTASPVPAATNCDDLPF